MSEQTLAIVHYLWACATLSGVTLLVMAWRGKRVNSAPLCRKCGFSLHRLPLLRCPECGSELRGRAIVYGERQRRPRMMRVAAGLLILCAGAAGLEGWWRAKTVDWMKVKPAWMLSQEARGKNPALVAPALKELTARAARGSINGWVCEGLVTHALEQQDDIFSPWEPLWGDFVETAQTAALVSNKDWSDYVRSAIPFEITTIRVPNASGLINVDLKVGPIRIGSKDLATIRLDSGQTALYMHGAKNPDHSFLMLKNGGIQRQVVAGRMVAEPGQPARAALVTPPPKPESSREFVVDLNVSAVIPTWTKSQESWTVKLIGTVP